jgi:hypothetical protein
MHDSWVTGAGLGSGSATYESQLRRENAAFGVFFRDLAAHGITKANTLFVITADEGDHFVGGPAAPVGCNGIKVLCTYKKVGEVDGNLTGMLAAKGITTPFDVSADSAPAIYVHGQPARTAPEVRALEQATDHLSADDLATGKTVRLTRYLADPVELKLLHMVTADPKRTPSFVMFANPDFWLSGGSASCGKSCVSEPSGGDAWNHGDVNSQINTTWLSMVGPGVSHLGVDNSVWSDHTDIQPTMMALLGLHDDYTPDGRVLTEVMTKSALPAAARAHLGTLTRLGQVYTQLEAPVGSFGLSTLRVSTKALASDSPGDARYTQLENALTRLGNQRDALGDRMRGILLGATLLGRHVPVGLSSKLIREGEQLLGQAAVLAH